MAVPFLACMALVAGVYHLPPRVLPSIQSVEGGYVGSVSGNADGSHDLGVMQVNTVWLRPLARISRLAASETRRRLVYDACFNIAAAGAILRLYLDEAQGDLMLAVGNYHSHTPTLNRLYQARVLTEAERLFNRRGRLHVAWSFWHDGPDRRSSRGWHVARADGPRR